MEQNAVNRDIMVDKYISNLDQLRLPYRPNPVRILFIGEARPASGRFFYKRDSGLYRAFLSAFQLVHPAISDANFLNIFQASGCYLVDLCGQPVDQLDPASRRAICRAGEPTLVRTLKELQPATIVTVVHSIRDNVDRAIAQAGWIGPRLDLPYPGRWVKHRKVFLEGLAPLLKTVVSAYPVN